MNDLSDFLDELAKHPSSENVNNQYEKNHAINNLKMYLEYVFLQKGRRILLVGEAPGYKGCGITGIPFTSGTVFQKISHPLLVALKDRVNLPSCVAEPTATIVWSYLSDKSAVPLFWNSFPFHPHIVGKLDSNRAPSEDEIFLGKKFIIQICDLYNPDVVAAIGRSGEIALKLAFPEKEVKYIRHPSFGGKSIFISGMNDLI